MAWAGARARPTSSKNPQNPSSIPAVFLRARSRVHSVDAPAFDQVIPARALGVTGPWGVGSTAHLAARGELYERPFEMVHDQTQEGRRTAGGPRQAATMSSASTRPIFPTRCPFERQLAP